MAKTHTITVSTHGAKWFVEGIVDDEGFDADIFCPECHSILNAADSEDNSVAFEHPKKSKGMWSMKCQCLDCGCLFTVKRKEKDIVAAWKKREEEDEA